MVHGMKANQPTLQDKIRVLAIRDWFSAHVEGHPEFGDCHGDTPEEADRAMRWFLADNSSSIDVVYAAMI